MNLFQSQYEQELEKIKPLAARMRPQNFDEFVGQSKIIQKGTVLREAIEYDSLQSVIFYGPPGCGKSTLAQIIASFSKADFVKVSAVTSKVAELREIVASAKKNLEFQRKRTILLIDEIHRFNKAQQDALLPAVEDGVVTLIGITTENPYFEVNSPLLSRLRVFELEALTDDEVKRILQRALNNKERGLGKEDIRITSKALDCIVNLANGDARTALNALELAALATSSQGKERKKITLRIAEQAIQKRALLYDKKGNSHYDAISAFIKSMRASDAKAALYWLTRMLYAGEDPKFIARRMIIFASEDIGNAYPQALSLATAAAYAVDFVGLPECRLNLAQAALYLATAPKSREVVKAIDAASKDVEEKRASPVPENLRNPSFKDSRIRGFKDSRIF